LQFGVSRAALIDAWKIEPKQLDSEVRLRLLFDGDEDTYSKVKRASDGFEHGFLNFHDIRTTALALRESAAGYLRRALLRLSGIPASTVSQLVSHPYTKPFQLEYTKYLWGTLKGKTDQLAAPDQEFPIVTWRSKPSQRPNTKGPDPEIIFEESFTPQLAPRVQFQLRRLEVWGAQPDQKDPTPPSLV
jgi:hypothetical protein